jgi:Zn-dependent protease
MEVLSLVFIILIFLFSVIIHEVAHGLAADSLGDPTPRLAGRLTLNPIPHLDPVGSFIVPLFLILMSLGTGSGFVFGWAKPVPVNPHNFRDQKYGDLKVGAAGVSANLFLALIFGIPVRFLPQNVAFFQNLSLFFSYVTLINLLLAVFNLFPLPPFDGSHIVGTFFPSFERRMSATPGIQFISIILAIFFLLYIGYPLIIAPLTTLITGVPIS